MEPMQVLSNCSDVPIVIVNRIVSGSALIKVKIDKHVILNLDIGVVSGFYNSSNAGILLHVKGRLYVSVLYNSIRKIISVCLIDSKLLNYSEETMIGIIDTPTTVSEATNILSKGIVKSKYLTMVEPEESNWVPV